MNAANSSPNACVVLACSGSSEVGEIADRAARKLERLGLARMLCLAGVGGHADAIEEETRNASIVIVLDGCAQSCGAKMLKENGVTTYLHVDLSEFGIEKGNTQLTELQVNRVVDRVAVMLRDRAVAAG